MITSKMIEAKFSISYIESVDGGYVGIINEIPGVMTQGETISELKENLLDAMMAMFDATRFSRKDSLGSNAKSESLQPAC